MLIPFPLGALGFSVAMDVCHTVTGKPHYAASARRALDFGLGSAVVAAPFGLIDYLGVKPGTRARRVGAAHAGANLLMLGLFATSRWLRSKDEQSGVARWLSGSAFVVSGVAAWLGGELVNRHAIGVNDNAHQDAPSSLSPRALTRPELELTNENYTHSPREVTHDWGGPDGF